MDRGDGDVVGRRPYRTALVEVVVVGFVSFGIAHVDGSPLEGAGTALFPEDSHRPDGASSVRRFGTTP